MALVYIARGDGFEFPGGLPALSEGVDVFDPDFQVTVQEVRMLRSQLRDEEVAELLRSNIEKFPADPYWKMEMGNQYYIENKFELSLEIFKKLRDDSNFAGQLESALKCLDILVHLRRHEEAVPIIASLSERYPHLAPSEKGPVAEAVTRAKSARNLATCLQQTPPNLQTLIEPEMGGAFAQAGMIILTKDEADILGKNLEHHYRIGFRNFFIADNKSSDGTAEIIVKFRNEHPDALVCYYYDVITSYYQGHKMAIFHDLFVEYLKLANVELQWMFFIDTDELLSCGDPRSQSALREAMNDASSQIIVFHWVICASEVPLEATPADVSPYQTYPVALAVTPPASKVAIRVGTGLRPTYGNHWVVSYDGALEGIRVMLDSNWYLFHFMTRSFEQMKRKVINGGKAFLNTKGLENHGQHWKQNYDKYLKGGDSYISEVVGSYVRQVANGVVLKA